MSTDPKLRDEIAGLTEAVHELRDREVAGTIRDLRAEVEKLRAERTGRTCCGGHCGHVCIHPAPYVYTPWVPYVSQPYTVTCGTTTTSVTPSTVSYTTTNAAGGTASLGYAGTTTALS